MSPIKVDLTRQHDLQSRDTNSNINENHESCRKFIRNLGNFVKLSPKKFENPNKAYSHDKQNYARSFIPKIIEI